MHCDSNVAGRKVTATSCALLIRTSHWHASHWLRVFFVTSSPLGTFANSGRKKLLNSLCLSLCLSACLLLCLWLSVCMGQSDSQWEEFCEILYSEFLLNCVNWTRFCLKSDKKPDTLLGDLMYVWDISLWFVVIVEINCCPWGPGWGWRNNGALSVSHALF